MLSKILKHIKKKKTDNTMVDINNYEFILVEKIKDKKLIEEFEEEYNYSFPKFYKENIEKFNGGSIKDKEIFDTQESKGRVLSYFLSFNKDDDENIWAFNKNEMFEMSSHKDLIAFADDPFGNSICFNKKNNNIYFFDHETLECEKICDSFEEFLLSLYSEE